MHTICPAFHFKVEIRYNLPSSRGEICKFDLNWTVKETEDQSAEPIVLPKDEADKNKPEKKEKRKKPKRKKGKGCKKLSGEAKKRCKNKGKYNVNKKPQKYQPVKSIDLKVCAR